MGVRRWNKSSHFIEIYPSPLSYLFSFSGGVRPAAAIVCAHCSLQSACDFINPRKRSGKRKSRRLIGICVRAFNNNKIPRQRWRLKSNKMQLSLSSALSQRGGAWEADAFGVCVALYQTTRALAIKAGAASLAAWFSHAWFRSLKLSRRIKWRGLKSTNVRCPPV